MAQNYQHGPYRVRRKGQKNNFAQTQIFDHHEKKMV